MGKCSGIKTTINDENEGKYVFVREQDIRRVVYSCFFILGYDNKCTIYKEQSGEACQG